MYFYQVNKPIKILSLFLAILFFHDVAVGEQAVISEADSAHLKAVSHSDHSSSNSYLFVIHQQAQKGIISSYLNEIQLSESRDHLFEGVIVEADIRHRAVAFLHACRIINQYSELTKLIFPFHFFF